MEVKKIIGVLSVIALLSACAESKKTVPDVMESKDDPSMTKTNCQSQMLENKYVVLWEDGTFTYETGTSEEKFKKEFVEKNLDKIKKVYYDRTIKFFSDSELITETEISQQASSSPDQLWGQRMVQAENVWSQSYYGEGVLVGVVDSYVDITHLKKADVRNEGNISPLIR